MTPEQAKLLVDFYGFRAIVDRNDHGWAMWPKDLVEAQRALIKFSEVES